MASLNKTQLIGHLGRDPEVRYTPSGTAVANVSIATSRQWKNKDTGEKTEETEWHRVVFYERLAEIAGEWLKKGKLVYIEGRLKTRKWQDKEGRDQYTTEIIAEQMQMLGGKEDDDRTERPAAAPATKPPVRKPAEKTGTGFDNMDDDIPFADPLFRRSALLA